MKIAIDNEFRDLLPPLEKETLDLLEKELIADGGCRDSLILWDGILVDGHNRYSICKKHNLKFDTKNKEFNSREEVIAWIISTQISRRNLNDKQIGYYRGKHYEMEKRQQGGTGANRYSNLQTGQNVRSVENHGTSERLAEQYNVTPRTIRRDGIIAKTIDRLGEALPEAKQIVLSGKANINKKELEKLNQKSDSEIKQVAHELVNPSKPSKLSDKAKEKLALAALPPKDREAVERINAFNAMTPEEKIADLERQLREERARAAKAESELVRMKEVLENDIRHKDSTIKSLQKQVEKLQGKS